VRATNLDSQLPNEFIEKILFQVGSIDFTLQ